MTDRPVLTTYRKPDLHWVGDGFLTQGMLPHQRHVQATSPFLLAGYNPPHHFPATDKPRGVGMHPHRGFETVTIVFQGGVEHRDTLGHHGRIGPGDVQWMTAAKGLQHEEFHSDVINARGGTLEMVQLWVNLPARSKQTTPRYQDILAASIPEVTLPGGGRVRVIAGALDGAKGPAETATPLQLWDAHLPAGAGQVIDLPAGQTLSVLVLEGRVTLGDRRALEGPETVVFSTEPGQVRLTATTDSHYLLLAGEPIEEPIAMGGPFVMNSDAELQQAYRDFRDGKF